MIRVQDFTLPGSTGGKSFQVRCKQIRLLSLNYGAGPSSTASVLISLPNGGGEVPLQVGQGIELAEEISEFSVRGSVFSATHSGRLLVGDGSFLESRIQGTVQVIDGEREKVQSGVCFRGIASVAGGGTGGALAQLWNAGAGINLFVTGIRIGAAVADSWSMYSTTTQAPTLIGTGVNMDRSLASSLAVMRSGNDLTAYAGVQNLLIGYLSASQDVVIPFDQPVMLRPSTGLILQATNLATSPRISFAWDEVLNS